MAVRAGVRGRRRGRLGDAARRALKFSSTAPAPPRNLEAAGEAEFALVQRKLGLSASALSKHVTVLMDASCVEQRKAVRDTRQRVWLRLTRQGRAAYQGHLAALRAITAPPDPAH
ncbi:transcriptional regulator [Streptomyces sp. NPDC003781]|uniref:transcriptional regulator n=1 Tax=Streptomyces sp. NPDC003781 TaxID=3364686 RepID=UPI0036A5882F